LRTIDHHDRPGAHVGEEADQNADADSDADPKGCADREPRQRRQQVLEQQAAGVELTEGRQHIRRFR